MQALPMQFGFVVAIVDDYDRDAAVAEFLDGCEVQRILRDILSVVLDAAPVEPTLRSLARLAIGLRVNGDVLQKLVLPIGMARVVRC